MPLCDEVDQCRSRHPPLPLIHPPQCHPAHQKLPGLPPECLATTPLCWNPGQPPPAAPWKHNLGTLRSPAEPLHRLNRAPPFHSALPAHLRFSIRVKICGHRKQISLGAPYPHQVTPPPNPHAATGSNSRWEHLTLTRSPPKPPHVWVAVFKGHSLALSIYPLNAEAEDVE
jgi:hypothetical protein